MLILIAESKTMTACDNAVGTGGFTAHRPVFEDCADLIVDTLRDYTPAQLAEASKLSQAMVRRLQQMLYEFPNKVLGSPAIEAYTGVVFKALSYRSLDTVGRADACGRVRIISSLYGLLRPDDIIKAYRLDFTMPLAPGGKTFASHWRQQVTDRLIATLNERGDDTILNLLPGDAAKMIDWRQIEHHARVIKAEFHEIQAGGITRTPNSNRLKTLRGLLLRQIITDAIDSPEALINTCSAEYAANPALSTSGSIVFTTVTA